MAHCLVPLHHKQLLLINHHLLHLHHHYHHHRRHCGIIANEENVLGLNEESVVVKQMQSKARLEGIPLVQGDNSSRLSKPSVP